MILNYILFFFSKSGYRRPDFLNLLFFFSILFPVLFMLPLFLFNIIRNNLFFYNLFNFIFVQFVIEMRRNQEPA